MRSAQKQRPAAKAEDNGFHTVVLFFVDIFLFSVIFRRYFGLGFTEPSREQGEETGSEIISSYFPVIFFKKH